MGHIALRNVPDDVLDLRIVLRGTHVSFLRCKNYTNVPYGKLMSIITIEHLNYVKLL